MGSDYFELRTLDEGVYAAIGRPDSTAYSNAAILDLGDRTVVVDTFMMPKPAEALAQAARDLTGRETSLVLLTHYHQDHWGGASAFADALYAATPACRAAMLEDFDEYQEWQRNPSDLKEGIETAEAQLADGPSPEMQEALETRLRRDRAVLEELPALQFRAPEMTIDSGLTLHGSKRSAVVRAIGHGHTESDLCVEVPDARIVICGDLCFFSTQPFTYDCDPDGWIEWLKRMEASEYAVFVPGHGPVGGKEDLALLRQYIETLTGLIRAAIERGDEVERALTLRLPEPFAAWQAVEARRFEANVRGLYERFAK
jgi:cyclase